MLAQPDRHRRRAARRHRQSQFRQSRAARDHGPAGHGHQGHRRGLPRARLPDRLGQCLALQRDQRPGHPADPDHRRRRPARRLVEDGAHRLCRAKARRSCWSARRQPGARISASRSICATSTAAPTARRRRSTSRTRSSVGDFVRALIRDGVATAVPRLSDGGLAVALAEMAMASGIGATVDQPRRRRPDPALLRRGPGPLPRHGRSRPDKATRSATSGDEAKTLGILAPWIGTTGGAELKLGEARAISVAELQSRP